VSADYRGNEQVKSFLALIFIVLSLSFTTVAPSIVSVIKYINHTSKEIKRNQAAVIKIRETVNGQCFKDEVLDKKFIQTNNKTSQQVLDSILESNVNIKLSMYRSRKNTVGYTYPSSSTIWMNRKYHDHMDPCDVGANLSHEHAHKLGYKHAVNPSKSRANSVPYAIGKIIEKCCKD